MEHRKNLIVLTIGLLVLASCSHSEGNGPQNTNPVTSPVETTRPDTNNYSSVFSGQTRAAYIVLTGNKITTIMEKARQDCCSATVRDSILFK